MALQAQTVVNLVRGLTSSPSQNQGRWADGNILNYMNMAQGHLVQELLFPESRLTAACLDNVQLYQLPDTHRIYRVWLNGQIVTRVDGGIETLQGMQVGFNDQTAQGVPITGSDAPQGAGGVAQPQWSVMTPVASPYLSNFGPPAPITGPAQIGMMPRYYERGGAIGFVPAPANAAEMTIDGVFVPPNIGTDTQYLSVPQYYQDALVWYTVMLMKFSDDTSSTQDQRNFAMTEFEKHLKKLRFTVRQYKIKDTTTFVRNDRYVYAFGRNTNGGYGNSNG